MSNVTSIVRSLWANAKVRGHVYCRRVPGARQDAWIIHHGKTEPEGCDDAKHRFVTRCQRALAKEGLDPDVLIFQLKDPGERARLHGHFRSQLDQMLRMAFIAADRIPEPEWPDDQGWEAVCGTGDRIEMWEKAVQRKGAVYRVIIGSYDSWQLGATCRDSIMYVGGRRGAMLYSGFR